VRVLGTGAIYAQNLGLELDTWRPVVAEAFARRPETDGPPSLWLKTYGLFANEGSGAAPGFSASAGGIVGGVEGRTGHDVTLGATVAYDGVNVSFADANGAERVSQVKAAAYARYESGATFASLLAGGDWSTYSAARVVDPTTAASAHFSGTGGAVFAEAGHVFAISTDATLTPSARLGYVDTGLGGFSETGADDWDLSVNAAHLRSLDSVVGMKAEKTFRLGDGSLLAASVSAGWDHQFLDTRELVGAAFADGTPEIIAGTTLPRDGAVFTVRMGGVAAGRVRYFVSYDVKVDGLYSDQTAGAGVKIAF